MTQTHISYKTAKALKEFCPDLPEPISEEWYTFSGTIVNNPFRGKPPAYQLHDLLSKPFCKAFFEKMSRRMKSIHHEKEPWMLQSDLASEYYNGGLPAVEKALLELMEEK